ncbi:DnaD/phage-associated domain protein [Dehalococcoides mccartyi]|uniref:DnaD/phage-associated domain protein n=2 Tax=Dehalococcoides mccartyi TaxID=61435 RepID=A0A328ELM4_9CHLR|nr:DnaD/phage-associated domain protein [Dehalococcoides mccartyi]
MSNPPPVLVRQEFTPVSRYFIHRVAPLIEDPAELKVSLAVFSLVQAKKGYPRYTTLAELGAEETLMNTLGKTPNESLQSLEKALKMAVERGTLLGLELKSGKHNHQLYFINTEADTAVVEKIKNGSLALPGLKEVTAEVITGKTGQPNIFKLYEQNIGLLTPMLADNLKEAEKLYPEEWIAEAIKEAVSLNKHNWRYIERILENWSSQGKNSGTHKGNTGETDKYKGQLYDHLVQR